MNNDSPQKALLVVLSVALFCSILVSTAAISLRPLQERNALVERSRNIVGLTGLSAEGESLSADEILTIAEQLDIRVVDLETGLFEDSIDAATFSSRTARGDDELGITIPSELDIANLGRRSRYEVVYLVWENDVLARVIFPIVGQGMWSTLWGFVALESDLNTIAAATFYEQAETAGLGDQITRRSWLDTWQGRRLYGQGGVVRFRVASGPVEPGATAAAYEVDALTGATVTGNAVTALVSYWFGPHGYGAFLNQLQQNQPQRREAN